MFVFCGFYSCLDVATQDTKSSVEESRFGSPELVVNFEETNQGRNILRH